LLGRKRGDRRRQIRAPFGAGLRFNYTASVRQILESCQQGNWRFVSKQQILNL